MESLATLSTIELFTVLVGVAAAVALIAKRLSLAYTVALVLFGLFVSALHVPLSLEITPQLVLSVLLPGLVFEAAYQTDFDLVRRSFRGIAFLAVPGVLISAALVAAVLTLAGGLPFGSALLVGAVVSATDPAAVISTFKRLGAPARLATIVEAESLLNDGTAVVVFAIALQAIDSPVSPADALVTFITVVGASLILGAAIGLVASVTIARVDDHLVELTISLFTAYGGYLLADRLHLSGIITTVVAAVALGTYGRRIGMSDRTREAIDVVWEFIAFLLTAIVFLLVGLAISVDQLGAAALPIFWGVVAVLAARAIVIYPLLGGASRRWPGAISHRGIPVAWLHVMFWSGLRGAVAVALALSLPPTVPDRQLLQSVVFGIVLFTLLVQGTTADVVLRRTGVASPPGAPPPAAPRTPAAPATPTG